MLPRGVANSQEMLAGGDLAGRRQEVKRKKHRTLISKTMSVHLGSFHKQVQ